MDNIVKSEIPGKLQQANCGYREDGSQEDSMTKVHGVPLSPDDGTWKGQPTGNDSAYPDSAQGLVFADYAANDNCSNFRGQNPPSADNKTCNKPGDCEDICTYVNDNYQYCVDRVSKCKVWHVVDWIPIDWDGDGNPIAWQPICDSSDEPTDNSADCQTCNDSDAECNDWYGETSTASDWQNVGQKYECTGDIGEENARMDGQPDDGCGILQVDYGWVGLPPPNLPAACVGKWGITEKLEHKNCMHCGPGGDFEEKKGEECRTALELPPPTESTLAHPVQYDAAQHFEPVPYYKGETSRIYEAFFRKYTATHELGTVPKAESPNEYYDVHLACYKWYKEKDLDPTNPNDLNCIADDLQLDKLKQRKINDQPTDVNKQDSLPQGTGIGGFALDEQKKKEDGSTFSAPGLAKGLSRPSFGETPKYVTVMQNLEQEMEGFPPTVQLFLPLTSAADELKSLFQQSSSSSSTGSMITDLTVPLQPGLVEAVRATFRQSVLSRTREYDVPVVVPLASDADIQTAIQAWKAWKEERKLLNKSDDGADDVIQKLQSYATRAEEARSLRANLPIYLAAMLDQRKVLSDAIDQWISDRMKPYNDALAARQKQLALFQTWVSLKNAYTQLGVTNIPYCKNDTTTPPLLWMELDDVDPPDVPAYPKHLVFDFSDIFFKNIEQAAVLQIPVLKPIQVAIDVPLPPDPHFDTYPPPKLPDLPSLTSLPAPPSQTLKVETGDVTDEKTDDFPYAQLQADFENMTGILTAVNSQYQNLLWVKEKHEDLACPQFGANGCVFPETKLWNVFMRIWSPIGAFLNPGSSPAAPGVQPGVAGIAPACLYPNGLYKTAAECLLQEKMVKKGLRVTLPKSQSSASSIEQLRTQMREQTIDSKGSIVPKDFQYNVDYTEDLYNAYPVPADVRLEFRSSSSSSS